MESVLLAARPSPSPPADCLAQEQFFLDPLQTLITSDNFPTPTGFISTHDVAEAYHTLSTRIERYRSSLEKAIQSDPALRAFRENKANLIYIIRRDILRALEPPNITMFSERQPSDHGTFVDDTEELRKSHVDEVTVCHEALKLVMAMLQFPVIVATLDGQS